MLFQFSKVLVLSSPIVIAGETASFFFLSFFSYGVQVASDKLLLLMETCFLLVN